MYRMSVWYVFVWIRISIQPFLSPRGLEYIPPPPSPYALCMYVCHRHHTPHIEHISFICYITIHIANFFYFIFFYFLGGKFVWRRVRLLLEGFQGLFTLCIFGARSRKIGPPLADPLVFFGRMGFGNISCRKVWWWWWWWWCRSGCKGEKGGMENIMLMAWHMRSSPVLGRPRALSVIPLL